MKPGKKTLPSVSTCCVKMLGSAPKSMADIIDMCKGVGYETFYAVVGVRATLGWHDELSGSKSIFVSDKPFDLKPGQTTYYSSMRGDKYGCIDQTFWVHALIRFDGANIEVMAGTFDSKVKRTVGAVMEDAFV